MNTNTQKYYETKYNVISKWKRNNCINCKHFHELMLKTDNFFNPNFSHYAMNKCPYMPDDMISYGPGGEVFDKVLVDFRYGIAWINAGRSTEYCKGWSMVQPDYE